MTHDARPGDATRRVCLVAAALFATVRTAAPAASAPDPVGQAVAKLEAAPLDTKIGNDVRRVCREAKAQKRCIDAFEDLVRRQPGLRELRYNAALAYVDELPGHTILKQGTLSTRSIEHASHLIEQDPSDWLAYYIRGLNNLYWPRWFLRTDRAVADLEHCVQLSEALPAGRGRRYHALAYVALGDAHAKVGRSQEAFAAWRRGTERFPGRADLALRLRLEAGALPAFVDAARDLDRPIDTDLSFLWESAEETHASQM